MKVSELIQKYLSAEASRYEACRIQDETAAEMKKLGLALWDHVHHLGSPTGSTTDFTHGGESYRVSGSGVLESLSTPLPEVPDEECDA